MHAAISSSKECLVGPAYIKQGGMYELRAEGIRVRAAHKSQCYPLIALAMINRLPTDTKNPTIIEFDGVNDYRIFCELKRTQP
jgi:hypothetical protein